MLRASELPLCSERQCSLVYNVQCGTFYGVNVSVLWKGFLRFRPPLKWPTPRSSALTTELVSLLRHSQGLTRKLQAVFDQGWN